MYELVCVYSLQLKRMIIHVWKLWAGNYNSKEQFNVLASANNTSEKRLGAK